MTRVLPRRVFSPDILPSACYDHHTPYTLSPPSCDDSSPYRDRCNWTTKQPPQQADALPAYTVGPRDAADRLSRAPLCYLSVLLFDRRHNSSAVTPVRTPEHWPLFSVNLRWDVTDLPGMLVRHV